MGRNEVQVRELYGKVLRRYGFLRVLKGRDWEVWFRATTTGLGVAIKIWQNDEEFCAMDTEKFHTYEEYGLRRLIRYVQRRGFTKRKRGSPFCEI